MEYDIKTIVVHLAQGVLERTTPQFTKSQMVPQKRTKKAKN